MYRATSELITDRGPVGLYRHCAPEFIAQFALDDGLGVFPQYRSIVRDRDSLSKIASLQDSNMVVAGIAESRIVAYMALTYPAPRERWAQDRTGLIYELGSIEVSRNWRGLGLATGMVALTFADDWLEDKIVVLTGYSWHWDLEGTCLTKAKYRGMLMNLFRPAKFRQFHTDEPNIALDFANLFMARIGSRVSNDEIWRFYDLLFANREQYSF